MAALFSSTLPDYCIQCGLVCFFSDSSFIFVYLAGLLHPMRFGLLFSD
ncbi:hypothetical protein NEICINOT_05053 [Neisseria cinerea ATCC 14685]|uniref:Uncharacterized protein n=1 Tax=Neisseria cinerea ATCC 14685 TaxID=546262 RepID=D0W5T3_NEICI|nr:hypothetical protein NEICINOT_05053 [Neisseria cinerea ATCC 14685]